MCWFLFLFQLVSIKFVEADSYLLDYFHLLLVHELMNFCPHSKLLSRKIHSATLPIIYFPLTPNWRETNFPLCWCQMRNNAFYTHSRVANRQKTKILPYCFFLLQCFIISIYIFLFSMLIHLSVEWFVRMH